MHNKTAVKLLNVFFAHVMLDADHMGHQVAKGTQSELMRAIARLRQCGECRAIVIRDANKRTVAHTEALPS